jgi:SAM-dependent methyltransferase
VHDDLAQLHIDTYNSVADEYEARVETYREVTAHALSPFIARLPDNATVLDIGCAVGYTVEILNDAGKQAEGIDIAPAMIEFAKKRNPNATFVVGDFLEQPYPPKSFDGALLYAFIHLFPKEIALQCMTKVVDILKPGGHIFIGTTKSAVASEGFEEKADYASTPRRYRKHWTTQEMEDFFAVHNLTIIHYEDNADEFGKVWMDYVVQKNIKG